MASDGNAPAANIPAHRAPKVSAFPGNTDGVVGSGQQEPTGIGTRGHAAPMPLAAPVTATACGNLYHLYSFGTPTGRRGVPQSVPVIGVNVMLMYTVLSRTPGAAAG